MASHAGKITAFNTPQFPECSCSPRWVVLLQAGPQEEGDRVKTKPVSCSTVGGKGVPVKRTSQLLTLEDEDESSDHPAPSKASKIGFSMSSKMAPKSNPISIKLGATVSVQLCQIKTVCPKGLNRSCVNTLKLLNKCCFASCLIWLVFCFCPIFVSRNPKSLYHQLLQKSSGWRLFLTKMMM